eukprot:9477040-Pyramimonas_sp.AAC.1
MRLPNVRADLLFHDDACHFEQHVQKNHAAFFRNVTYFLIGKFHLKNHERSKRKWTKAEATRAKGLPPELPEIFNSWIRSANFFLNAVRPASHRFWVSEFCEM